MKRLSIVAVALLLATVLSSPVLAEEAAADLAPLDVGADGAAFEAAGCELPDLAGMSQEEIEAAALEGGFEVSPTATAQACPVKFSCDSITNCAAGPLCSITDIGPCCSQGGLQLCCISGTIKVRRCPCECTSFVCSLSCANSTDVQWRCS